MAVKFLDYTGLGYFWSKIKAWCNATFAAITHNQASNTINAMTGYSKPNSGSAIAISDNLNSAIGKLEAKVDAVDDSNYVHKTGTEVIDGEKTFKGVYERSDTISGILIRHPKLTRGDSLSSTYYWQIALCDRNGVDWADAGAHGRCGTLLLTYDSLGNSNIRVSAYKNAANNTTTADLVAGVLSDGTVYATAPQTSTSRTNRSDIVTRGFLEDKGYLTSHQDISGKVNKSGDTMTGNLTITDSALRLKQTSITRGTAPSANNYPFFVELRDNANHLLGGLYYEYYTNRAAKTHLMCYKGTTDANTFNSIGIGYDTSGNEYTWAPTPATADNSTKIATTAFVKAQGYLTSHQSLSNYVTLSGEQQITGYKKFIKDMSLINSSYTAGSSISSDQWWSLIGRDTNSYNIGGMWVGVFSSDKHVSTELRAYESDKGGIYCWVAAQNKTDATRSVIVGCGAFYPNSSGTTLGKNNSTNRWGQIYSSSTTIQTSDERVKTSIDVIPDEVLDAWENFKFKQFQMKDAVEKKGENARLHTGGIAQEIDRIFKEANLDARRYGMFCWDEWEAEPAEFDESGYERTAAIDAGEIYSLRYEELLCMEAAYQRRKNKILENRISELEKQVSDMLQILQSLKGAN